MKPAPNRIVLGSLYVLFLGSLAWFAYRGLPYYLTPLAAVAFLIFPALVIVPASWLIG